MTRVKGTQMAPRHEKPRGLWSRHSGPRQAEIVLRGRRIDSHGLAGSTP